MKQYEAMFVFDPTFGANFETCETEVRRLMERAGGEIILCRKWDERRLAYRINGRKRGVYVLTYFKAPPEKIAPLERDAKLSENILRLLVLGAEGLDPDAMERSFTRRGDDVVGPGGAGTGSAPKVPPPAEMENGADTSAANVAPKKDAAADAAVTTPAEVDTAIAADSAVVADPAASGSADERKPS